MSVERKGTRRLETIAGSMFSGKTEELIRRITRLEIAGKRVQVFKPIIDDRYGATYSIKSHSGGEHSAIPAKDAIYILENLHSGVDVVAIDEVQFFDRNIVPVVHTLTEQLGLEVIVAGLPLDFRGEPFGSMPELLALSDEVTRLTAICDFSENGFICGDNATRTQRFVNGKPAKYDDPIVVVGGKQEGYAARCVAHHIVPGKPVHKPARQLAPDELSRLHDEVSIRCGNEALIYAADFNGLRLVTQLREYFWGNIRMNGIEHGFFGILFSDKLSAVGGEKSVERFLGWLNQAGVSSEANYFGARLEVASCIGQLMHMSEEDFNKQFKLG